jgi:hypothetical protein
MLIYVTCKQTSIESGLKMGFNQVSDALGQLFIDQKSAYGMDYPRPFPALGFCDPDGNNPPAPPPPAPPPSDPPPPPPAPAPSTTLSMQIGPEDQHIKIDTDGDGKTDVHVIVDNPPQNP